MIKRRLLFGLMPLIMILILLLGTLAPTKAQAGDPYSLVDAVNNLRAANGLPALEINGILMSIAQGHSEYQAAIGQVTHTGAGGTRPRDRAAAAGYGGGGTFFISENIAGGTNLSVDGAISMWLGDDPHIQTMLGGSYREIGAGVAESGGFVYYTIDVAYVAGGGNYSPPAATRTPGGPTAVPIYFVQTATPNADGSIIHVVRSGQTLIGIAKAYGLTLAELKALNNLISDVIYEGDKLLIRTAFTPGPTATATATSTPTRAATATKKPTRTPTPSLAPTLEKTVTPLPLQKEGFLARPDAMGNVLVITTIVLASGGVILMVVGSFIKRKPPA